MGQKHAEDHDSYSLKLDPQRGLMMSGQPIDELASKERASSSY
uniref:Uncharacterized protein n=1 Tax=Magnetococcus massalia (strain MO-1) TaxID=451514 RepID=A0A1S7LG46_MAGMO|nr:protein of unknown function [Candidatus Magnetococcus massalia]